MRELPKLQALVLADHVWRDPATGKCYILGTFNNIYVREVGGTFDKPTWVYFCVTNLRGTQKLDFRYWDLRTNEVLMRSKAITVESQDPLGTLEGLMKAEPLPVPHVGTFAFAIHRGDDQLGSIRLQVMER